MPKDLFPPSVIPSFAAACAKKSWGKEDAYAVTGLAFSVLACAVFQRLDDLKGTVNDSSFLKAVDVDDSADTAVVMLQCRIVKPLCFKGFVNSVIVHTA